MHRQIVTLGLVSLFLLSGAACGDDAPAVPTAPTAASSPQPPATLDVPVTAAGVPASGVRGIDATRPPTRNLIELPAIEVGGTIRLGSDCATSATWASSDTTVATVDNGLVTGVSAGTARISETCGSVTSTVVVEVVELTATFAFDPVPPATITVGDTGHFRVNINEDGRRQRLTEGVASSAEGVVRLNLEGDRWRYTGVGAGSVEIRVVHGGVRRLTHSVRVEPKPEPWSASGTGSTILDLPTRVTRIRIEGEYNGYVENFIVWCGTPGDRGGLLVNEILGRSSIAIGRRYSGVHSARRSYGGSGQPCRELDIGNAGITWTITETAPRSGSLSPSASVGSLVGDEAAVWRARERVKASRSRQFFSPIKPARGSPNVRGHQPRGHFQ